MPSPLSGTQTEEQDVGSDDEDRNELFAILQEASSDDDDEEVDEDDTQEDDDNDINIDVEMEEQTSSELRSESIIVIPALNSMSTVIIFQYFLHI